VSGNILLDTNIVIGLFGNDESILTHLSESEGVFLPSIAIGELYYGAYKSAQSENNIKRIDELVASISVLICDAGTALHYGRLKKDLKEKGKPLPENDIWIAAIAKQNNLTVASRDQHFKEIDSLEVAVW